MLHRSGANVPRVAVLCFFNELLEQLEGEGVLTVTYVLRSEIGRNPIYEFETNEGTVSVVHPGVGAPLAAGFVEEVAALKRDKESAADLTRRVTRIEDRLFAGSS